MRKKERKTMRSDERNKHEQKKDLDKSSLSRKKTSREGPPAAARRAIQSGGYYVKCDKKHENYLG